MKRIAVIGGGITGITTAYTLAKRGLDVTVFEKHRYAAMETSFANGGQLSASNAEVWNNWQTVLKGMKWMMRPDAPLLVNPKPSWHKLSWFAEFIAAIPQYEQNTTETARLAIAAREHLFEWAKEEGIDFALVDNARFREEPDEVLARLTGAWGLEYDDALTSWTDLEHIRTRIVMSELALGAEYDWYYARTLSSKDGIVRTDQPPVPLDRFPDMLRGESDELLTIDQAVEWYEMLRQRPEVL